ncbi:MAG: Ig-like domain-containing protein [Gemmatimonadaceae bacterium]|nr:Ig-like domain-containing protein [Gemmatimonadaceae bacterium]
MPAAARRGATRLGRWIARTLAITACVALAACKGIGDITAPKPVEAPVAALELSVEQLSLAEGGTTILQVTARDAKAAVIANPQVFWSSSDTTVARVSTSGVVTGVKSGTATIAASAGGRSATVRVTVAARAVASVQLTPQTPSLLVGGFVQLTARTFDDAGAPLSGRTVFWSTSAATTAVVDVNGLVTGIAPGVATITATSESRSAAVGVTVAPVPVATVQITPPRDTIVLGQTTQLTATVRDSVGAALTGRVVTWSASNTSLATVSSTGLVLGVAPGTVIITATSEGRTTTATIVVQPRPVGAVIVSPTSSALIVAQTVQLNTQITDGSGNLLTGRPLAFSSSNANVASVSASGLVTAIAPGAATITVTSEGKTGTASVTVSASPVASLRVTPATASLIVGATTKLSASALDAGGAVLPQRTITWSSGAPSVATVAADGTVSAVGAGTALIFASAEGKLASATITVSNSTVSTFTVTPATPTIIAGQAADLTATLRDPNGVPITGRSITWSSSDPAVALVSSTGRVRGIAPGNARIDAVTDALTASAQATVIPVPVNSVSVALASPNLLVGFTTQANAVARDSTGAALNGRTVTWASSAPAIATVNAQGLVTAVALGTANIRATIDGVQGSTVVSVVTGNATAIAAASATTLSAAAGTPVPTPPSVRVVDAGGSPIANIAVSFAITGGGGSTTPANPAVVTTNANGIAALTAWTLGATAGTNTLTATVNGLAGSPVAFTAQGTIGAPATLAANSVTSQTATSGTAVATAPSVKVTDAFGNPVAGVAVTFTVATGGGAIVPAAPATVLTDNSGIASLTSWTLGGPAGPNTVTATVTGLSGSPVTFSATGTVGTATTLLALSSVTQSATAGSAVSTPPSVKVVDVNGNGVPGRTVTFAVVTGGGSITPASPAAVITDANGIATLTTWTLGAAAGANSVSATATGLAGSPITFNATGVVGAARNMSAVSVTTQSATAGSVVSAAPSVRITDVNGNPVSGVAVGFTVSAGGGSIVPASPASVNTDANGIAALTSWALGTTAGANSVTAAVGGLTGSPTLFNATGLVGAATRLGVSTQPAGAVSGSAFTTQPVVQVRDANNNVVTTSTAAVTVAIASGTGTLSGTTTVSAVNGVATFTNLQIIGVGPHTLTFTSTGLTAVTTASFTVNPGAPTQLALTTQPAGAVSGLTLTTQPVVQIRDANGNLTTSSASVTAAIASGNGTLSGTTTVTAVNGVATFTNLVIAGSGAQTLTFTSTGLTAATSGSLTVSQTPTTLSIQTQPTTATSGAAFSPQPVVRILDNAGLVVTTGTGATLAVTATVASGTGTLAGTATVNAVAGVATFSTLNLVGLGAHTLRFATTTPALAITSGTITVAAGAPALLAANSVTTQSAVAGSAVSTAPSVRVTDATGNPVSGVNVTFTVTSGGGSSSPASPATVATNASGIATLTSWTLGTLAGANSLTATVTGLSGSPVTFNATGTVGAATTLAANSLTTQTATVGTAVGAAPSVRVTDANGNGVSGVTVVFAVASGGGTIAPVSPASVVTNASGIATLTSWTLGATAGANTVTATVTGLSGSPLTFTATGTAGAATTIAATTATTQSATVGSAVAAAPSVRVTDANGNGVSGVNVTFSITAGGGTTAPASPTTIVTNASGVAALTTWTLGTTAGANTLTAAATGLIGSPVTFNATGTVGAATQVVITTQPSGAASGTAFTTQPVLAIRDANGNTVTSSTAAVTVAIASGTGTLSGTTTVNAVNGVVTFTNLALTGSGAHTLLFSSTGLTSATSQAIALGAGAPAQLAITTQPAGAVSGVNFTTQPVVQIRDGAGNLTASTATVTAAIASGTGTLSGTTTVTAVNGVATFTNLRIAGSGAHTLTFTSTGLTSATSSSLTVTQTAASLSIQTQPSGAVSSTAFTTQPVVRILDNAGLVVTSGAGASLAVTAAVSSGSGTLGGTVTATAVNGVATFTNLAITGSGAHALQFTTTAPALSATSNSFSVAAGAPTQLAVTTQPAGAVSASPFTTQPVVAVRDADGNVTTSTASVTVAIASGSGVLSGTTTVTAVNGVATFTNLTITGTGAHTLTFTSAGLTSATSASFSVGAQVPTQLALTTQPAGAVSGVDLTTQPVVIIRDAIGNTVTGSTAPVTASITSGTGTLVGTATVNAVNGVATFTNLRINGSGAHTLTFASAGLTSAVANSFTVTQVAVSLSMQAQPAGAVSGTAFTTQPIVRILDNAGLVVVSGTGASLVVTAARASGTGTLGGTLTATAVNGIATFTNLSITGTGAHTLSFSTTTPALTVNSASVTVAAGAPTQVAITTQPAGAVSGSPFTTQPVVQLRDAGGNLTTSTAAVTVSIASGTGVLSGTTTVNAVNGVATFANLVITGTGAHTLTFASAGLTSATSNSVNVTAPVATQLAVTTQPAGAVSGVNLTTQPVVEVRDANNAVVTGSTVAVTAAITSGNGTLVGTATVNAVNGIATFTNLRVNGSGAQTITFTSAGLTSAASNSFTVTQVAASLSVQTQPAGAVSSTAFTTQPVVRILDNAGLVVTTGSGASLVVTAAKATGTGTLGGTLTATAVNGVATFTNLAITGSGAHTLQFSTAAPALSVTSTSFTVAAGAPTQLAVTTQPAGAVSGSAFTTQPVVAIRDADGNLTTSTAAVTVAIATGTGTLSGTTTVNAVNGVATFTNLALTGTGAFTLTFTGTGLTSATSTSFTVAAQTPTQLAITTQPAGAVSGVNLTTQPVVEIRDAGGVVVSGSTAAVTAAITSGNGTLVGTATVNAVNGVATFTNLRVNGSGAQTITFSSTGLTSAASASFTVTQVAASLSMQTQPAGAVSGTAFTTQPVVRILDNAGLVVTTGTGASLVVTAARATGAGTLSGTLTATAVNGVATFTNLAITGTGAHTLSFSTTTPALTVNSASFTVAAGAATQVAISTQPAGAVSGVAFTTQPVVQLRDAGGNVSTSTAAVTATIATGTGTLSGTTTVNAVNGVATFTNLAITGTGAHTLTFASAGLTSATSNSFTVTAPVATQLAITTEPSGAVSGVDLTAQPVVEVRDAGGAVVPGSTAAVTAAITSGNGTLVGTATVNAVNGVATFTNLRVNGSGAQTITFTSASLTSAVSASFTVTQVAASLSVQTQPAGAVSGTAFSTQPVVRILDNAGLVITTGTGASLVVTAAKQTGTGTLGGTLTATAVNGVATFSTLAITGTGAHTLQFTTATPALSVNSASFTVAAGAATQLAITTQPAGAVSGVAFTTQPVVAIRDADGNLTTSTAQVTASVATGTGTLSGTTTVTAVNGVATFSNLVLTGSGAHTLTFASTGLTSATSNSLTVTAPSATQLAITTQPAGAVSGVNLTTQPVVEVRDAGGLVVTGSTAAVTAAITSGNGTLVGTATVNAVNGIATFTNLRVNGSGAQTITFSSAGLTSAASASFTVTQVAASLSVQTQPAGALSSTPFTTQPVIRILDNAGLVVTTGSGASLVVTAAKATGTGTLGGTLTATASNGVATFTDLAITGSGAHTLSFSTTAPALTVNSASLTVLAGTATQVAISTQPAGAVSGVAFTTQPVVQLRDADGNVSTSTAAVTATVASGAGTLGGTTTVNAVNGVATFTNLAITGTGAHTLTFTSAGLTSATSASFTVTAPPATQLAITTQPGGAVSGVNLTTQPVVEVRDAGGAVVTGSTAPVTAAITTGNGTLVGTATVNAVNGIATFTNLRVNGSGAQTITFTSGSLTSAASTSFTVTQVAASLSVQTQPAGAVSGSAFTTQPVVRILDNAGLVVTTGSGASLVVTAAKATGTGTLGGTLTATASNGVATFSTLAITGSGAHSLQFTTASPALSVNSTSFTVAAGAADQLAITTQPAGAVSGLALGTQPVVEIRDNTGTLVTGSTAPVTAAITTGTGTLVGTATVNAVGGVATFTNLRIDGSGAHVITFSSGSLTTAVSNSFTVTQVAAALSVQTEPAGAVSGTAFTTQPVVRILDNAGLVVTSGSGASLVVTAAKATGSGTLGGTLTATATNGVATFGTLAITGSGAHTLQFTTASPALSVNSSSFTVIGPATQLAITTQPAGAVSGVAFTTQPVVEVRDASGNRVTSSSAPVTVTIATGTGALVGTATVNAVNGVATFPDLQINGNGSHTLTFSSGALTDATSNAFTVTQVAASLVITTQPVGGTSGTPLTTQPVIEIRDNAGLLVTTGTSATLPVTASIQVGTGGTLSNAVVTASGGIATFNTLTLTGTGSFTLRFATTAPALTVDAAPITMNPLDHE